MVEQIEKMTTICPYWRRFIIRGDKALALCGMEFPDSLPYPDTDLGSRRLSRCPWFNKTAIYDDPVIVLSQAGRKPTILVSASFAGLIGLAELESYWEKEVVKFHENFSYPS